MENVKITNRACVLQLLVNRGAMSRTDIASVLSLTTATVTTICNEFISKNLLIPGEETDTVSKVGRKRNPIDLNYDRKHILTIDIDSDVTTVSITNLKGRLAASDSFATAHRGEPAEFFRQAAAAAIRLLWTHHFQNDDILGAGVTIVGPVNHTDGISLDSSGIFSGECNIKKYLEQELPFTVCVENSVSALLSSELLFNNPDNLQNVLMLKWGPDVGSASVINGVMYKGSNFRSSELGLTMIDQNEPVRFAGRGGRLESLISMDAIAEKAKELYALRSSSSLLDTADTYGFPNKENFSAYVSMEDPAFQEYLDKSAEALAIVTNNAIQLIVPDKIILFGDIFDNEAIYSSFINHANRINPELTDDLFICSELTKKKAYIGGTAIILKQLLIDNGGTLIS